MYLGVDIGTSSIKALLIDEQQQIIGSASAPVSVQRPHTGWSEQQPDDWLNALQTAMNALKRDHQAALGAVRGIGLSGQMHGATLIGTDDRPLRPCILWNDGRAENEAKELDADPEFRAVTGNIVFPGFTAPKLVWVQRHEPDVARATRKVLLPKDYVRLWLAGDHVSDMSDAAGTAWLDVGARRWSSSLLGKTGMDTTHMPRLVEGSETSGQLRVELATEWGMDRVAVAGGGADNAAAACGAGIASPGSAFVSLGTSGVVLASNDGFRPNAESAVHAFCHAMPGTWYQMGVILSAAASLEWLAGVLGRSAADLTSALGDELNKPSATAFLPYLAGERTPHNDAVARGTFAGLNMNSDPQSLTQAVLEGVSFALKDCQLALRAAGTELSAVTALGGGSKSDYWLKLIATVLDIPVNVPAQGDFGAAFGAARLGLCAETGADPLHVCAAQPIERTIAPDKGLVGAFETAHQRWQRLYPAVKAAD